MAKTEIGGALDSKDLEKVTGGRGDERPQESMAEWTTVSTFTASRANPADAAPAVAGDQISI